MSCYYIEKTFVLLCIQVEWTLERFNDGKNFTLAVDTDVLQFNQPVPRLQAIHGTDSPDWFLIFEPIDRDDIGNLTCKLNSDHLNFSND